jgi:hypothetical protein
MEVFSNIPREAAKRVLPRLRRLLVPRTILYD